VDRRLFNHLVGADKHSGRNGEAERLGCSQVYYEFELGWLLDGKVGGLCALEDAVDIADGEPYRLCLPRAIGHETTGLCIVLGTVHGWQSMLCREVDDAASILNEGWSARDQQRLNPPPDMVANALS
jgi:hypothetical protein